jgi:MFS transporter, PAT family, beta-lactamase induction signal transducer AmpG
VPAPAPPTPPDALPAPAPASTWARLAAAPWVASTYFAEGLPYSIVRQLSSELFTSFGMSPKTIGATSLYGFAWNFKFLWSPLIERHGTLRRWLLALQALLGLTVMAVAWAAGRRDLGGVAKILVVAAFLAATHDISIDGFYLEALEKGSQAALAGPRIAAYRAALLAGKGLLMLAGALQALGWDRADAWRATFVAAGAALVLLAGAHALVLPRPARIETAGPRPRYVEAFVTFLRQPHIAVSLVFILLYKAGDSLMFAMNAPFLKSLGFNDLARGTLGTAGLCAGMAGGLLGGGAIGRYSLRRALRPIVAVQSLAILLYVALAAAHPRPAAVWVVAVAEQLAAGIGDAALAVFLMKRCSKEHKAAHFAIASALMSVTATVAGVSSGFVLERVGFPTFFAIAFAASLPGLGLAWMVPED